MSAKLKEAIEGLALQKPPIPVAAICRQARRLAQDLGEEPPSYWLVYRIVAALPADHGGIGLVLIGMPGIEKRLARYPQFYSRIGFVHEFRPLANKEVRELLDWCWAPPSVCLPQQPLDAGTVAAIIRITSGNFRLLNRLLTHSARPISPIACTS
jgi:hypothetical protein